MASSVGVAGKFSQSASPVVLDEGGPMSQSSQVVMRLDAASNVERERSAARVTEWLLASKIIAPFDASLPRTADAVGTFGGCSRSVNSGSV